MRTILIVLLCIGIRSAIAAEGAIAPYALIQATVCTGQDKEGKPVYELRRYFVKEPAVMKLGERAFISGLTPSADGLNIEGSDWHSLFIPVDAVQVIAGLQTKQEVLAKANKGKAEVGQEVK